MKILRFFALCLIGVTLLAQKSDFVNFVNPYLSATPGNRLSVSLGAYYKFDEASGNALDSSGNGLTLTETGTMGTNVGVILGSRVVNAAGTSYFSRADNAVFEIGTNSFTLALWVKLASIPADGVFESIVFKGNSTNWSYQLLAFNANGTPGFQFLATTDGQNSYLNNPEVQSGLVTNQWYCVVARADSEDGVLSLDVRSPGDGAWQFDFDVYDGDVWQNTVGITFGVTLDPSGVPAGDSLESGTMIDEMGFWNRYWTNCERDKFFENGTGRAFATFDSNPCL